VHDERLAQRAAIMPPGNATYPPSESTTSGRMRKSATVDCRNPMRMRNGRKSHAAAPLPRMPLMLTLTIG
jgi:hypothetical protein